MNPANQLQLLQQRRFLPYLITLFLGALNDNIFKNSLLALITFGVLSSNTDLSLLNNLAALLFIAPFFLFSAIAGQMADKYEPSKLIRHIKFVEIIIMSIAVLGFYLQSIPVLLVLLFLMGSQSAFFGPIKYSIIPKQVDQHELIGANGLVEMATFVAILLGTLIASALILQPNPMLLVGISVISLSVLGWLASRMIPKLPTSAPKLSIQLNIVRSTYQTLALCLRQRSLWVCNLGISWFWFLGASYLTQIYLYAKQYLMGDQTVVMSLLAMFSIGIGMGSFLCERLNRLCLANKLCLLGGIGLTIATLLVVGLTPTQTSLAVGELSSLATWLPTLNAQLIVFGFFLMGLCGGLYIVPLYARIQRLSQARQRAQIIAAINIINALAMILSAVVSIVILVWLGQSLLFLFALLAVFNLLVLFTIILCDRSFLTNSEHIDQASESVEPPVSNHGH